MQRLVEAVVATMQGNATISKFIGITPNGQKGPFQGIAPEGTPPPYVVFDNISGTLNQGFKSGIYGAVSSIAFTVRHTDPDQVATYTESMAAVFDTMSSLNLAPPEICRKPLRLSEPRYYPDPIENQGKRMYAGVLEYRFNVQRTEGQ